MDTNALANFIAELDGLWVDKVVSTAKEKGVHGQAVLDCFDRKGVPENLAVLLEAPEEAAFTLVTHFQNGGPSQHHRKLSRVSDFVSLSHCRCLL